MSHEIEAIYARIMSRLKATEQSASGASKKAGKPDAIRNMQRSIAGERSRSGISSTTIAALAPVLECSPEWLLTGKDGEAAFQPQSHDLTGDTGPKVPALIAAIEGSFRIFGLTEDQSSDLIDILLRIAQEPPTPSAGPDFHRVLAESEVRRFLKSTQFRSGDT